VADRVTVTAGDFFTDRLPDGCDAYVLKAILHNWPDGQCGNLLTRVSDVMRGSEARLIIIDQIVPPLNEWDHSKVLDMDMLVLFGGKERTLEEWRKLLDKSGFELLNSPAERGWSYLEARLRWP
jgi:multifunctional cyclase/dehydratase/O-methyltransferase